MERNTGMRIITCSIIPVLFIFGVCGPSVCQGPSENRVEANRKILRIGTKEVAPFAFKNSDGAWTGISIELWKHLADEMNFEFELEELTLPEMLSQLETGELDAGVAAITVTSDRHEKIGFCHPHYSTGLGIAVRSKSVTSIWTLFRNVMTTRLIVIILAMVVIVVICGVLFWLFEHKKNTAMFGSQRRQGIGIGMWWSTILLFGHKGIFPVSAMGRVLAIFAMIASIVVMLILTGVITSVLTLQQLDDGISRATDLHDVRVATVSSSTSESYLRQRRIAYAGYETIQQAMQAVEDKKADAVVYDSALLKYLTNKKFMNRVDVLPTIFNVQEYAFALPPNSNLRKPLNEKLLKYRESDAWDELLFRYLGE